MDLKVKPTLTCAYLCLYTFEKGVTFDCSPPYRGFLDTVRWEEVSSGGESAPLWPPEVSWPLSFLFILHSNRTVSLTTLSRHAVTASAVPDVERILGPLLKQLLRRQTSLKTVQKVQTLYNTEIKVAFLRWGKCSSSALQIN